MKLKKILSAGIAAMMALTALAGSAMAAFTYNPVTGTSTTFNKFLIIPAGTNVPAATFSFTVAPGEARSADTSSNGVMQVLPGVGTPTIANVTFSSSDTTATDTGSNIDVARTDREKVKFDSGEQFATKTATIDFSSVSFTEPGIYRYIISETASIDNAAKGIIHDDDTDRVLDVYVIDNDGKLEIAGYVMHMEDEDVVIGTDMGSADVADAAKALDDKTDGFTNEYKPGYLDFAKEVSGNQASHDKYFEFTVEVEDLNDADTFVVSLADDNNNATVDGNADATSGTNNATIAANAGKTNPTSVTGAQLKTGVKFYLQHGQNIVIRGLPINAKYTVTENAEDYKSAVGTSSHHDVASGTIGSGIQTGYTNTRNGVIPTGVVLSVIPGLAIVGAAGAGIVLSRKKKDDEDEA